MRTTQKKILKTRYFYQTMHGTSLCFDSVDELKYNYLDALKKDNKGEKVSLVKQDMYSGKNVNTIIETFTV